MHLCHHYVTCHLSPGAYLITQKDVFFDRSRAMQLAASILSQNDRDVKITLPPPAIMKVGKNMLFLDIIW